MVMNSNARRTQPARILQICPHDSAPFGSLLQAYAAAARLAELEVVTVVLDQPDAEPIEGFIYLGAKALRNAGTELRNHPELRTHLEAKGRDYWDLVLCHRYAAFRAALKLNIQRQRIAVLAHEYNVLASWRRRLLRILRAPRARFGGVSPTVSAQLAKHTRMGFVLPNVLDLAHFESRSLDRTAARAQLGLDAGQLIVGVVGRLHYKKRPELAMAAFQEFVSHAPQARLLFVGDGDPELKAQLSKAGAIMAGNVPDAARYFSAFDVLLHTGNVESFGMVVLEAMASGVPVVVGDGGGPEYVLGQLGFYPPDDNASGFAEALGRAVTASAHPETLATYQAAALARTQQMFSIESLARSLRAMTEFVVEPESDPYGPFI